MNPLVTVLAKHHKREQFDCGQAALTRYLQEQASQDVKRNLALCFVSANTNHHVTGYYTLSSASIPKEQLNPRVQRKMGYKDIPVTLLGRLAVDITMQRKGHGESLLMDALYRSYQAAQSTSGSVAVVTDPIDDRAASFYTRYGFSRLEGSKRMYIMMETIGKVFEY